MNTIIKRRVEVIEFFMDMSIDFPKEVINFILSSEYSRGLRTTYIQELFSLRTYIRSTLLLKNGYSFIESAT